MLWMPCYLAYTLCNDNEIKYEGCQYDQDILLLFICREEVIPGIYARAFAAKIKEEWALVDDQNDEWD